MARSGDGSDRSQLSSREGAQAGTSAFGRGWIPLERDIGLPGDALQNNAGPDDAPAAQRSVPAADALPQEGAATPVYPQAFTPEKRGAFLLALAEHGNVRLAARAAGTSAQSAYVARRRDAGFAAGWEAALLCAADHAGQVLADRAIHGVTEPVWFRGEVVGTRTRYDNRLLLAHVARLDAHAARAGKDSRAIARDFDVYVGEVLAGQADPGALCLPLDKVIENARRVATLEFPEDLCDVDDALIERAMLEPEFEIHEDEEGDEEENGAGEGEPGEADPEEVWEVAQMLYCEDAVALAEADWHARRAANLARVDALLAGGCDAVAQGRADGEDPLLPPMEFKSLGPCKPRQPRRVGRADGKGGEGLDQLPPEVDLAEVDLEADRAASQSIADWIASCGIAPSAIRLSPVRLLRIAMDGVPPTPAASAAALSPITRRSVSGARRQVRSAGTSLAPASCARLPMASLPRPALAGMPRPLVAVSARYRSRKR